jgi:hypothetical protein
MDEGATSRAGVLPQAPMREFRSHATARRHATHSATTCRLGAHQATHSPSATAPPLSLCDILTQGLIGLVEYSYHKGIPSFSEAKL